MIDSQSGELPNILFIQADQMTRHVLGCYGHPTAITPNIDRLASEGVLFESAYCNSPLCGPSRNSMMSGRLPHKIGSYDNANELPASVPTFAHVLRHAGYSCWLSGKMHFVGPDQLHGFHGRTTTDIYPAGFDWTPDWTRGVYPNHGTSVRYLHQSGPCDASLQLDYDEETTARGLRSLRDLVRAGASADGAATPFLLCVSFSHPHDPFVVDRRFWELYEGVDIPEPVNADRDPSTLHPFDRWIQTHHEVDTYPPSADSVRNARRAYLGMTSYIDEKVGLLVSELERLGVADNTVVVFTSDHGDMQGEHRMWYKRSFREWSLGVPLIIRDPRRASAAGLRLEEPVSLVDLLPTFADIAGVGSNWPGADGLDGESLIPNMDGDKSENPRAVFAEYCGEGTIEPVRIVRRDEWKYIDVNGESPQLFNLASDPNELDDVTGMSEVSSVEEDLRCVALAEWDGDALRKKIIDDQQLRLYLDRALQSGGETTWDYEVRDDAKSIYVRRGNSTQGAKRLRRWPLVDAEE